MRDTNTFVVNIDQKNWTNCVRGPSDESSHDTEYVGQPWQGVPAQSTKSIGMARDIRPRDLVLARVKGRGFMGVWEFQKRQPIADQSAVPWADQDYTAVLYCHALHRAFDTPYKRTFDSVRSGYLQGAVVNLPGSNPPLKQELLEGLLSTGTLNDRAERRLKKELGRPVEGEPIDISEEVPDVWTSERIITKIARVVRNTQQVTELKDLYNYTCQMCGDRRRQDVRQGYAEGHHLRPLGAPHSGPDIKGNILIVCPNHHADFDYGTVRIEPESLVIRHLYDDQVDGRTLDVSDDHPLKKEFLQYHNKEIAKGSV